jgi:formylglycine-generating enzyme
VNGLYQAANVWEWNETKKTSSWRVLRGGSFGDSDSNGLRASWRGFVEPTYESYDGGFWVASIPEPSMVLLVAMASLGLLLQRRAR